MNLHKTYDQRNKKNAIPPKSRKNRPPTPFHRQNKTKCANITFFKFCVHTITKAFTFYWFL